MSTQQANPKSMALDSECVVETIARLEKRIGERFPNSGLREVCEQFHSLSTQTKDRVEWIDTPIRSIRWVVYLFTGTVLLLLFYSATLIEWKFGSLHLAEIIQLVEALINDIVLIGAAIFFLLTVETRVKRSRSLKELHKLRSLAHVVDMHQLTKDPSITSASEATNTPSSPQRSLSAFELVRYLEYCSELLSLIGKVAALYSVKLPDSEIVSAANEIEDLCTGLSRKIWQKIMMID